MKIGIISDSHDNLWRLDEAIPFLQSTDVVLHCGDLISPFMVHRLGKGIAGIPVHLVWGNNDGDRVAVIKAVAEYSNLKMWGDFCDLEIDDLRIAVNHYPEIGRSLAESDRYDLVCYGHDHTAYQGQVGQTWLLNPGEIMGLTGRSTLMKFDTETRKPALIEFWTNKS
jgi:putative phosphoesterase